MKQVCYSAPLVMVDVSPFDKASCSFAVISGLIGSVHSSLSIRRM